MNPPYLLHDHVLAFPIVSTFGLDNRLQELEVLHVLAVSFYEVHKVLNDTLCDFVA